MPGEIVRPAEWHEVREFAVGIRVRQAALAIEGEAGAGKSTLWRAGVEAAAEAGHLLMASEPSLSEMDLSFVGLSDLLVKVLSQVGSAIPDPQRNALEVALLLRATEDEPPTAHAVGLAVLAALRACVSARPVLIAIDDVHWLDEASLDALVFALRRIDSGPLSMLVTARAIAPADPLTVGAQPPSRGWLQLVAALGPATRIDLAPLDSAQVRRLLPSGVTAAQARLVAQQSRGNPFWAREISGNLGSAAAPVPPAARALTERLASSLDAAAAEALAVVAAAGRIGVPEALAVLSYLDDPHAALDAAVLAGVVVEAGDRVTAAHPLIGAAAIEALLPGRRQLLYERLAVATPSPERYAHFAALAAAPGPDAQVADALDAAAEAAHARAANAGAGQFAAQAVLFTPGPDEPALARRLIRAGELLFLAGDLVRSLEHLERLDLSQLAIADLERVMPLLLDMTDQVRGDAQATAIISGCIATSGTEPRERALEFALASDFAYGIPGRRRALAVEAIRCAEVAGEAAAPALHRALVNLFVAKAASAEGLDTDLLDRAARLESGLAAQRLYDTVDLHRGLWASFIEDLDSARLGLQRTIARATDAGDDWALSIFLSYLAAAEELAGDYAAAAAAADAADAAAAWHDWPPSPWRVGPRCELLIAAGDLAAAASLADEHLPVDDGAPLHSRFIGADIRGRLSAWRGDPVAAARHFEHAGQCAGQLDWADPGFRRRIDLPLAQAYVAIGRPGDARRIAAWLAEIGERLGRPAVIGDAHRIEALVAAEGGDLDRAAQSAQAAVAAHGSSALRPELAHSLLVLARIERRRRARKKSLLTLRRAHELATGIGHKPLLAEIQRELPPAAARTPGSQLTAAERRVARLVAGGATNREAATELFVSVRTVEAHVASIYRKLGVHTRVELVQQLPDDRQRAGGST